MADIRLRPRFKTRVQCDPATVLALIDARLSSADGIDIEGTVFDTSAVLRIPAKRRHFWSPELQVGVDAEQGGTLVSGMFGPRPGVWSMYVALYAFALFAAIMGGSFGTSQIMLGQLPLAFWSLPGALAAALVVYGIGRVGRRLGREQIQELDAFLNETLAPHQPAQSRPA